MRNRVLYEKACMRCGQTFLGRKEGLYCGRTCGLIMAKIKKALLHPQIIRPCKICGKDMTLGGRDGRNLEAVTCSRACATKQRVSLIPNPLIMRICLGCQKPFYVGGRKGKSLSTVLCSRLCARRTQYQPGKSCQILDPVDAAYIAGFIDGEGCISIGKRRSDSFYIRVTVVNTKPVPLQWMVDVTGLGKVHERINKKPNYANLYRWLVQADGAATLLQQIRPYLRIKGPQADLAMELQEGLRIPDQRFNRDWQLEHFMTMHDLNRRGRNTTIETASLMTG